MNNAHSDSGLASSETASENTPTLTRNPRNKEATFHSQTNICTGSTENGCAPTTVDPSSSVDLNIAVSTFLALPLEQEECEVSGLPKLPNSVNMIGRFQDFISVRHPHLCQYLDIQRDKHERLYIVSEHHVQHLDAHLMAQTPFLTLVKHFYHALSALASLHSRGWLHHNLTPENVMLAPKSPGLGRNTSDLVVKLHGYALFFITDSGREVGFPIGSPFYSAPEVLLQRARGCKSTPVDIDPRCDVFSLAAVFLTGLQTSPSSTSPECVSSWLRHVFSCFRDNRPIFERPVAPAVDNEFIDLLMECVRPRPNQRPFVSELLSRAYLLQRCGPSVLPSGLFQSEMPPMEAVLSPLPFEPFTKDPLDCVEHLLRRPLEEQYLYWCIAGGNLQDLLRRSHLIRTTAPVLSLPRVILSTAPTSRLSADSAGVAGSVSWDAVQPERFHSTTSVRLPGNKLFSRVRSMDPALFYPIVTEWNSSGQHLDNTAAETEDLLTFQHGPHTNAEGWRCRDQLRTFLISSRQEPTTRSHSSSTVSASTTCNHAELLPVKIKESDVEYQIRRVITLRRLLAAYPHTRSALWRLAYHDVPPLVRPEVWRALLGVSPHSALAATRDAFFRLQVFPLDERSSTQIGVDLPRCHSYDPLVVCAEGQTRLRRILTAWLIRHPQYEYTQGLDSVCAIFLHLFYQDEATVLAMFEAFVERYMRNLFVSGLEPSHEYFAVVEHLLAFHYPDLFLRFREVDMSLTGFLASWMYTMLSHSFTAAFTMRLWDFLLLGDAALPMFLFVAIMRLLSDLQVSKWNELSAEEMYTLFSQLPDFSVERVKHESLRLYCNSPASISLRTSCLSTDTKRRNGDSKRCYLALQPIDLATLKASYAPRISAEDLLLLLRKETRRQLKDSAAHSDASPRLIVTLLDIREASAYQLGCVSGSWNVPSSNYPDWVMERLSSTAHKATIKVVLHHSDDSVAVQYAQGLVQLHVRKVCILQGGVDLLLRHTNILTVPS